MGAALTVPRARARLSQLLDLEKSLANIGRDKLRVDAVSDELSGRLIPPGDYESFTTAVIEACLHSPYNRDDIRDFASEFSWERYSQQLRKALGVDLH